MTIIILPGLADGRVRRLIGTEVTTRSLAVQPRNRYPSPMLASRNMRLARRRTSQDLLRAFELLLGMVAELDLVRVLCVEPLPKNAAIRLGEKYIEHLPVHILNDRG